ncbi:hypothetical protein M569_03401 [Genlisea aurea]|uniref:Preprotein translocase subunit SECE1 n=1 Tax=Genlisea aurea TaxID=192259 RepID=S8E6C1_9LAMI|nr:hypothetical protein M569_03401 [Genlisea aurea]
MALALPHFAFSPSKITNPKPQESNPPTTIRRISVNCPTKLSKSPSSLRIYAVIPKASGDEEATTTADENAAGPPEEESRSEEIANLGAEIKKAMKEREQKEESSGFLSGVGEEIREIEWPALDRVLGTTGVVLGVIAGSSVVLLTVNAILAEVSDRVFSGKGVQDFFL